MIGTTDLAGKNILEPSAGKGDIVDFCIERGAHVTACEKNEQLATIVASKEGMPASRGHLKLPAMRQAVSAWIDHTMDDDFEYRRETRQLFSEDYVFCERLRALGRVMPSAEEVAANPRARSAVMRVAERTEVA